MDKHKRLHLTLENVWTHVDCARLTNQPGNAWEWINEYLTLTDKSAQFKTKRGRNEDPKICLLTRESKFLTGLAVDVVVAARKAGMDVTWEDVRRHKSRAGVLPDYLHDYQSEAVKAAIERTRGILHIPTGGGKTVCASALMQAVQCRWVFIVHRNELTAQARERFEAFTGEEAGTLANPKRVTMVTFQKMYSRLSRADPAAMRLMESAHGIIVDEAHTVAAQTFLSVMAQTDAYYRIGLTGTPVGRSDGRDALITGATGPVIYSVPADTLIEAGKLAEPRIRMVRCEQIYSMGTNLSVPARRKAWIACEKRLIHESSLRNGLIVELACESKSPCILFVARLAHGRRLEAMLRDRGVKVGYVSGSASQSTRKASLERLERGDLDVLIGTTIFDEGIDVPAIRTVILAGGGRSPIKNMQRIGRGMRIAAGKHGVDIYDIWDHGNSTLNKHSTVRRQTWAAAGYRVEIVNYEDIGE